MLFIGCHLSSAKGFAAMAEDALKINANTFHFFTTDPRGSRAKAIDPKDVATFLSMSREQGMGVFVAHAPYTLNACSKEEHTREFALQTMADDLARMEYLPGNLYNFHPGCHVGQGAQAGIEMIAELLNKILKPEQQTTVLLETMAGKGTEVGGTFEELRQIIDRVELKDKVGVCLDTCHIHDAGYDIVRPRCGPGPVESHPFKRQPEPLRQPQGQARQNRGRAYWLGGLGKCNKPSQAPRAASLFGNAQRPKRLCPRNCPFARVLSWGSLRKFLGVPPLNWAHSFKSTQVSLGLCGPAPAPFF